MNRRLVPPLLAAAILTGFSVAALPFSRGLFRVPRTPYDASEARFAVPAWILLSRAGAFLPGGASVVVRSEPPDPTTDTHLHRFAVGLLPGRRIVPAALWGVPAPPNVQRDADYEIVVGRSPASPPGRLLLEMPEGTVWKRKR